MCAAARPHIVIAGAGFGGLNAARGLIAADLPADITVVDRHNYHLFQPLLYQVATAGLSPGDIAQPIRALLRGAPNVVVRLGEVGQVDLSARRVCLDDASDALSYDYLVLALGVRHSYFGHDAWETVAPGLKSLDDALEMRRRILLAFEAAETELDEAARRALLTFVVVGGGPTGVELAGSIAEIARHTLVRDFRRIDPTSARVVLLEAAPRILGGFDPDLSAKAEQSLRALGVDVRTGGQVTDVTAEGVVVEGHLLPARTVLWGAGVAASPIGRALGVPVDRVGRVRVNPDLSVPGHPEVFVIGDLACFTHRLDVPLPGLAPVAIQQGRAVARTIAAELLSTSSGRPPREAFRYIDRGTMATIGRASGIAQLGAVRLWGLLGWLAWLFIHLLFLIGLKNKVIVLVNWTWSYVTFKRGARLITGAGARALARASRNP